MVKEEEKPHVQPAAFTYLQQPRNPPNFSGKGSELAHLWLKDYSRVAAHNGWDESMCLANVVFFLEGAARCWFDNVEESITTWNTFKEEFTRTFGDKEDYARRIESSLKVRAQKPDESVELYIQDVLNLCRQLNPNMSEEDRVGHLMKGVAENIYRALLAIKVTTTGEFTQHCRRIEKLNKNRISSVRFERIPTVSAINENEYHPLKEMIREIIREELRSAPNELDNLPPPQGLEDRVWQRVEQNLAPIDKAPVFHSRRVVKNFRSGQQNAGEAVRRKTDEFRTRENIPICFYCNRPGHVAKHCWDRRRDRDENEPSRTQSRFYYGRRRPGSIYMSDFMTPHMEQSDRNNSPRCNLPRSSSPYPGRGRPMTRRRYSRSPDRTPRKLGSTACKGGKVGHCLKPPQTRADLDDNYMWVSINGRHVEALIDTGASYSVVSSNFRKSMKAIMFESPNITLRVANNRFVAPLGKCRLSVEINGLQRIFEFLVLPNCSHDAILGWDFLESSKAVIDCGHSEISFSETLNEDQSAAQLHLASDDIIPPKCTKRVLTRTPSVTGIKNCAVEGARQLFLEKELFVPSSYLTIWHGQAYLWVTNFSKHPKTIPSGMCLAHLFRVQPQEVCPIMENHSNNKSKSAKSPIRITNFECREENFFKVGSSEQLMRMEQISACISPELPLLHKTKLLELLENFSEVFGPIDKTTSRIITKHRINTGDAKPSKKMPYRVSPSERKVIQEEVDRMMEMGVVQPSESPWASPVVLVRKKDGSVRFCVDYRGLNKMTKKDVYPLPRVDDALDCLKGANIYSTIDLKAGYWQIGIDEADREKTAFITPDGLFEFKVMPFGLCNAPATFERMMDNLLKGLRWTICLCYLDDVVIFADNFPDHLRRLEVVLNCFKRAGLKLNPGKCSFGASNIKILGHQVDKDGIRPDDDKIKAVSQFPIPKNLQQLRSFLGLSSYYRRFIKNYADIARPLNSLLSKGTKFQWNTDQERAFQKLKNALTSKPVLGHFDDDAPTELHTDASGYGIGHPYASRTLLKSEKNYSTTERECLAIVWAIGKFRPYLFGRPFKVITDHHSLCWLTNLKDPEGRLARWALRLQEYDVSIVYKTGRMHKDADCLSRNPIENTEKVFNDDIPTLFLLSDISKEQEKDLYITGIIKEISQPSPAKKDNKFEVVNGILYRKNYDPTGLPLLLVIPRHLRMEILGDLHDAPTAGHLGFAKTYDRIRRRFYWPGMYRSVRRYVGHCQDCQRRKSVPQLPPGYLRPIPPPDRPFQKVGIDLLGRFPISQGKKKWIVVCTDYLTKYAVTQSLGSGGAQEIAKFLLEEVILKHGAPREIVMDRGRNFQSRLIQELTKNCHIKKKTTTAYHPQTNGLTERLNRTIADMLSMYMDLDQKNWDEMLPFITFAYNTARQESTGFTPFFLVHGREAETTLDTIFPYSSASEGEEFIQLVASRAEEARQIARHHIFKAQETNKLNYDARHKGKVYQPGDLVWIFTPIRRVGLSEKLLKRYFGPYKVIKKISDVTYEVEAFGKSDKRRKERDTVHILRMKPYYDPSRQEDSSSEDNSTLQGLEPEENIAMVKQETQTKMGQYHFQPFRNPSIFTGERNQNPEKWLKEYHCVARYNCWDDSMCLANIYFFLHGTAHRWYENVEEKINSWDIFVKMFSQNFGHHVTQKDQLAENLKTRAQGKEETSDSYIQDVLHLCREVNPAMMENEIVAHLTKGISEEIYQSIIILDIATIDEFIKWCRKIEASNKKTLPNVAAIDSADSESMEDLIRRIVLEEVHSALNPESTTPEPSSLKEIIREEVEKNRKIPKTPVHFPRPPYKPIPTPLQSRKKLSVASSFEGEAAGVKNPPSSTAAKLQQNYVEIIDDIAFSALVDSGSSFSVISDGLRRQLKKTMFKDSGMTLKVADGKNVTSIGRCTISLSINGLEQPLEFIVLPKASNAVIDCGRAEIRLEEAKDVLNSPASMGKVVASRSVSLMGKTRYFLNLRKRYFGPYRVTRKLSDVTFEVEPVDQPTRRRQTRDLVHLLRMKPYHDPEDQADLFK
ncbi:hypothetical protein LAZ67_7002256 [Cordylochernes scorpioides]|uniref:RNA-directed DNA polymerase n=1 Tax=Cordylochernes scorpioides TaxID=51811 RepID=A0ABY6KPM1_9ARAC|nr:hypothetical protein LAZ67_7002256 [Cordylochernes scorpioides]